MESYIIKDLSFSYPVSSVSALRNISLSVEKGEFLVLAGKSGSGKSTLLRHLKSALAPHGQGSGEICFEGKPLEDLDDRFQAEKMAFVGQDPENQIVTDKVWHELAFGLESLGYDQRFIRRRAAEVASFFGMEDIFHKNTAELSGGQKQQLNLAAVMTTQPSVLILDEPTSQLDPISASEFISVLGRINRELGVTVIISEHRLGDVFGICSRVAVLDEGALLCCDAPRKVGELLRGKGHDMFLSMPVPMRVWAASESCLPCPISVSDGRSWLESFGKNHDLLPVPVKKHPGPGEPCCEMKDVFFRWSPDGKDVLKGLSLKAFPGECLCILGGNGAGKSTILSLLSGIARPIAGKIAADGRAVCLPQDPLAVFAGKNIGEDLKAICGDEARISEICAECRIESFLDRAPSDLSGGERQRAGLAAVLLADPDILLLDEPTKGLDESFKQVLMGVIRRFTAEGRAVIIVTHDVEFAASAADRCALIFDGQLISEEVPEKFFSLGSFYTTDANRMARDLVPEAVTANDLIIACGGSVPEPPEPKLSQGKRTAPVFAKKQGLPLIRKIPAAVFGAGLVFSLIYALRGIDLTELVTSGDISGKSGDFSPVYACIILCLLGLGASLYRRDKSTRRKKLSRRTFAATVITLTLIPITIWAGTSLLGDRKYYFIALLLIIEASLPFFLSFEGRGPNSREITVIAVLCAIAVAGRAVFIALPGFKPVMAVVIITGLVFGGEAGFITGAVSMFVSNMVFGQGPWTPWQMFAMGLIGFIAGVLGRTGILNRAKISLCIFGMLSAVIIYGGIMNSANVIMYQAEPNAKMLITSMITGFPVDVMHGVSTALFLWLISAPFIEKLERLKTKYGIMD